MLARRLATILPNLTFEEALEITKIHSIAGELQEDLIMKRPFRSPHYTVSTSSLIRWWTNSEARGNKLSTLWNFIFG